MNAPMEHTVSSALMRWRFIERAVHSHGTWELEYNGTRIPATRFLRESKVSIVGHFPAMCVLEEPVLTVTVFDDGEPIRSYALEEPLDESGAEIWIDLDIPLSESVVVG